MRCEQEGGEPTRGEGLRCGNDRVMQFGDEFMDQVTHHIAFDLSGDSVLGHNKFVGNKHI
jgi:hypothetical protein